MPPVGYGVGYPITYHCDITLIAILSMAAVLTGRLEDGTPVRGDLPGGDALVLGDQVRARDRRGSTPGLNVVKPGVHFALAY